jgi:dolichol-phosphate mannosyltransferase
MTPDLIGPATTFVLLMLQLPAVAILLSRLLRGPTRRPPLQPRTATPNQANTVSIVVPTLNEADRIGPCLTGLAQQGPEVREIIVVDSRSTDSTHSLT